MLLPSHHHTFNMKDRTFVERLPTYDTVQCSRGSRDQSNHELLESFSDDEQPTHLNNFNRPGWVPNSLHLTSPRHEATLRVGKAHTRLQEALCHPNCRPTIEKCVAPTRHILPAPHARRMTQVGFSLQPSCQESVQTKDSRPHRRQPTFKYCIPKKVQDPSTSVLHSLP